MDNSVLLEKAENLIKKWFSENETRITYLSDTIWNIAEVKFTEFESMKVLVSQFEKEEFLVKTAVIEGLPTSFIAEWKNGEGPVIAFIGEYDALPGLGNEMCTEKKPTGKNGHGCGHNLLGVGSMAAAISASHVMKELGISGTLKYFGCPAEEGGAAKVFMVRDGIFNEIDAIVRWHPNSATFVSVSSSMAMMSIRYRFHGKTSHAGTAPHLGRSALDAAILMDVGANYLREHVITDVRIHSVISDGGRAPNIVPDYAEIWYYIRAPHMADVHTVAARMEKIAKGAALMTETECEIVVVSGSSDTLPNKVLCKEMLKNLKRMGGPKFTDEDRKFATAINESVSISDRINNLKTCGVFDSKYQNLDLYEDISENLQEGVVSPYSTDSGDVSWQAPMCQVFTSAQSIGSANHSWQQVVCSGNHIGHAGMICAGETISITAIDILTNPELLKEAKKEFNEEISLRPYVNPLPKNLKPGVV
ncbi:amidohydrolase [Parasphaerochaeta coccoides]|uniref:Amidohydrolase n=1 Tax=Parasphaerochaeta coccoides (strain ATCC BAA-1237 / DSM 17374 / SPN1) TaxID=760011 RepID=F4GJ77_PARC1|nr:amidohydrolase [Parasphaerochaeta coccoides]AEC01717.1 amidohydrolase [Parasphaerochaeta coccoides DSM 17374]